MMNHKKLEIFTRKMTYIVMLVALLLGSFTSPAQAAKEDPPEEPARTTTDLALKAVVASAQTGSGGIAWGDPDGPHSTYSQWPITFNQMGHVIQSYQNYSSGTSAAYFHHGIDMIASNYGGDVYTRSGGQVVNVENYNTSDLYWEVAILDAEGYVWQYHHISKTSIPQAIKDAYTAYKANPATGGFVPANTKIGTVVRWTVSSFGYYFHHIHLNILGAGDVYLNPLEFHTPANDTQSPEIQTIGLLNGNTRVSGTVAPNNYGLYVRARDLFMSSVYYLPPYKTEFQMDGGDWVTVWEFDDLPGGPSDTDFVNDFYVAPPTCGNYSCRDFYIDLGFTTSGQRTFPATGGQHTVTVRVWDYNGNSATQSFTYTVANPVNTAPVANAQSVTAVEDTAKNITLTGTDADGNPLTYSIVTNPTNGTLSGTAPNVTYTSALNFSGTDTFTFKVNDGTVDSAPATVSITVDPVNDAPVADSQNVSVDEDGSVGITLTGSDVEGSALTFELLSSPASGSLTGTAPALTYTPNGNFAGSDNFTFKVNDGTADSLPATVSITVNPVNDPPAANDQTLTVQQDSAISFTLDYSDLDGDALTYELSTDVAHGVLSGTAPGLTYTPTAGFFGSDSFTYTVTDAGAASDSATVSITVTQVIPVNNPPTADAQSVTTNQDVPAGITLTGSDLDGDPLTFTVLTQPANGALSGDAPELTYTPAAGFIGSDSFTFKVNDGSADSTAATVNISVNRVNNPPEAYNLKVNTDEDIFVEIELPVEDMDNDPLTFIIQSQPQHGTLSGAGAMVTYTPSANYYGTDTFTYYVNDGFVDSNLATITINVRSMIDAPIAEPQTETVDEDSLVDVTLTGFTESGEIYFFVVDPPVNGILSGTAPNLTYTPNANYNGTESFTFKVSDGWNESAPAQVDITVNPVNDVPEAYGLKVITNEDTPKEIEVPVEDIDGDLLTFFITSQSEHGTLSGTGPVFTYTPAPNYYGTDTFTYYVNDGTEDSVPATINITVISVLDRPTADPQSVILNEDTPTPITLTGYSESGEIFFFVMSQPVNGTLSGTAPDLTFTPNSNFNGTDSFTFKVSDGWYETETVSVDITINPVNDSPEANAQVVSTNEDSPLSMLLTGIDVDGDSLSYFVQTQPVHGTLSGSAPNFTYTPTANYFGGDSFTFFTNDGTVDSALATVTITISPVSDAPVAYPQSVSVNQGATAAVTLVASDADGDTLTFAVVSSATYGTLSGTAPNLTYTPAAGFSGSDSFTFKANDGTTDSNVATVSITITPTGPMTVFSDNFENNLGWTVNPFGTDTAYSGTWQRANPESTYYNGYKQLGTTTSGSYDLVTGPLNNSSDAGAYDIDGGVTSIRSPQITLPTGRNLTFTFRYYMAHANNSSSADYLRVKIIGAITQTVLQELGANNDDDASWASFSGSLNSFAGQTVYILIEAADASTASLVEAAVDDILIMAQ